MNQAPGTRFWNRCIGNRVWQGSGKRVSGCFGNQVRKSGFGAGAVDRELGVGNQGFDVSRKGFAAGSANQGMNSLLGVPPELIFL